MHRICGDVRRFRAITACGKRGTEISPTAAAPHQPVLREPECRRRSPRYNVTDTGELSDQLDQAQRRWPEISNRKELLLKLAAAERDAIEEEATDRARIVEETAGALSGVYEPDELKRLREDWRD